jgi:hypothetical protein
MATTAMTIHHGDRRSKWVSDKVTGVTVLVGAINWKVEGDRNLSLDVLLANLNWIKGIKIFLFTRQRCLMSCVV